MDNQQYPNNNQQAPQQPQYQAPQQPQQPQYQPPQAPNYPQPPMYPQGPVQQPGKGLAVGALVCGIVGLVFVWFGYSALISLIVGIVGIILSVNAKKQGFIGGMNTAGLVMSIISAALGGIVFIACVSIVGCAGCIASNPSMWY
ncbi:MAG: hypothetical protein SOR38_02630 [Oscillospiraceae bacterium]|nr:hypothetical protein [Oscillospiraceae bacterium]MDY3064694.1 hypothetical protein [Oscillospiraceae bacterium]